MRHAVRAVERGVVTDVTTEFGATIVKVAQTDGQWQEYTLDAARVHKGDLIRKDDFLGEVEDKRVRG